MRRYSVALVLLALAGVCAIGAEAPGAPSAAVPATPKAVGDTWTNSHGMKFAYIPAGEFVMGSPEKEAGRRDDEKQHQVKLTKPFLLGVFEVTQGQWKAVMGGGTAMRGGGGSSVGGGGSGLGGGSTLGGGSGMGGGSSSVGGSRGSVAAGNTPSFYSGDDNLPVEEVSWLDATSFCQRLSTDGRRYRLPTEAEWEYACRAGSATPFSMGETISTDEANFNGKYPYGGGPKGVSREKTMPVGSFKANAWGLYDMHGNVWEWCADTFGDYPAGAVTDPGAGTGDTDRLVSHVMRGGSFGYLPENCRSAIRHGVEAKSTSSDVGFRVAVDVP